MTYEKILEVVQGMEDFQAKAALTVAVRILSLICDEHLMEGMNQGEAFLKTWHKP